MDIERSEEMPQQFYIQEFLRYLEDKKPENTPSEKNFLFKAFLFSQRIFDLIRELKAKNYKKQTLLRLSQAVQIVKNYAKSDSLPQEFLKHIQFSGSERFCKDRKVSFFRLILRHLKKRVIKKENQNFGKDQLQLIELVQRQVSNNTISKKEISLLLQLFRQHVVEYLNSDNCLLDILSVNKSRVNKVFYLLHLKDIAIEAELGTLPEYPFYSLNTFQKSITKMVGIFYQKIFQTPGQTIIDSQIKQKEEFFFENFFLNLPSTYQSQHDIQGIKVQEYKEYNNTEELMLVESSSESENFMN